MAVYTHLSADDISALIAWYDVGDLISAKGIAEGVSNSNWLIETTGSSGVPSRFILTIYEERTKLSDLPFFLSLLDHLSSKNGPVPRTIHDREGQAFRMVEGKAAALIEFLPGVSIDIPHHDQAVSVGAAVGWIHDAAKDFGGARENDLGPAKWRELLGKCDRQSLARIDAALPDLLARKMDEIEDGWPTDLPRSIVHADLFPDNVLMLGTQVTGLIDFYFACTDFAAYDLAVTHAAWSFGPDGSNFNRAIGQAIITGYEQARQLSRSERDALPILAQGAAMRFIATRAYDWIHTPADALVTRKDPMDFVRRLDYYGTAGQTAFQPR
ncbi:homoserine kinase [Pontixanthobacter gangjinensis]|uniref:Homoserine kinase n=1 Tax=Pontixanthobacter gangjinensis TaxID=1028742 RepID=A0A6I4SKI8_9SPHN|nr:homoserine kinase [Pontixanthobacter gangjinensis]MXO56391.1 homoserine kinase [Pontixanthobacter gangjinensis]